MVQVRNGLDTGPEPFCLRIRQGDRHDLSVLDDYILPLI